MKNRFCRIEKCSRNYYAKGYCHHHYDKNRRHDSPLFKRVLKKSLLCVAPYCDRNRFAKDLCQKHYMKIRNTGTFVDLQVYGEDSKKKSRTRTAKWKKDNWTYYKAYLNSRKKRLRQATPKWVDKNSLLNFYKNCPKGFHVDHAIPLNGKNVSGLHVLENLQYLTKEANLKKGSRINL